MSLQNDKKINLIIMGHFQYPHGMANTKRVQNSIDYLMRTGNIDIKVLLLRGERVKLADSEPCGIHRGVEYVTIGADIEPNITALYKSMKYFLDGMAYIKRSRRRRQKNIIYVYDHPSTDNVPIILFGKILGYKFVFDIVEDVDFVGHSPDIFARIKNASGKFFYKRLGFFADAAIVISKHLYQKTTAIAKNRFPVRLYPISVNFENFDFAGQGFHDPIRIFYGGTFGEKDGVENLICAFETVCSKHNNVNLILTGKGSPGRMDVIEKSIIRSDYRDRIVYKGYLGNGDFYDCLNSCDILCMTRTGSGFANTGFPFKLGEYLATGKPVIASKVSDIGEYLEDRKNAVVIAPGSIGAIAEAIEFLIEHPDEAYRIGANGRETAKNNFDAATVGEKLRQILMAV